MPRIRCLFKYGTPQQVIDGLLNGNGHIMDERKDGIYIDFTSDDPLFLARGANGLSIRIKERLNVNRDYFIGATQI